ncbi:TonB-dependent siderophore receptor [Phenylobacterium immobile]|uniref:TonB-dependent siderophore receptor n=1 Tax=Phenylobacterium immobile TaxID=21 RepID=UPI000AB9CE4F|nr:TonB-dependent siderophore receptor [Phenylobacterium immobile]
MLSTTRSRLLAGAAQALLLSAAALSAPSAHAADLAADMADTAAADGLDDAGAVSDVVVTGVRTKAQIETGPLGSRTILETPFSIARVDAAQITRLGATTIDAAFNYDASIRPNNSGLASGNTFSVRGLSVDLTNGYKYDGLAFPYWYQDQPIEALEQVQVLKGAGGFVYGYASPAGIVNFISKKPTDSFAASGNISLRSSNIWRAHVDVGGPFKEGGTTGFRLNVVHEEGTLYNKAFNKNQFATLWIQGEITPELTWSVDGFYQRTWQTRQSNNITFAPGVTYLEPVKGALNLGAPSTSKFNDVGQFTSRLNWQINPDWKASVALRYSTIDERFPGNIPQITNNKGDFRSGLLNQNRMFVYYVGQWSIDGNFDTGPVSHNVIAGVDYLDVNYDYDRQNTANGLPTTSYAFNQNGNIYTNAIPDWGSNPAAVAYQRPPSWFRYQEIRQRALFLSDTLKLGHAELLAGVRYTRYRETNDEPVNADTAYEENSITPVFALSYDVAPGARLYVSHVQALQRGANAPETASNFGQSLGPIKSKQYEAGVKVQRQGWGANVALFRTELPSDYLRAPAPGQTLGLWVRDGERRYQGVELDTNWRLLPEWYASFSVAYLDAVQTKAATAALVGTDVPGKVSWRSSAFLEYTPNYLPGFKAFGGLRYSGKARGQTDNSFRYDAYTVGDLGASYRLPLKTAEVEIRGNVSNVAGKKYWIPNAGGTGLSPGAPRTYTVSINYATGSWAPTAPGGAPAWVADGWYVGALAGATKLNSADFDIKAIVNPALGTIDDGLQVKHRTGWEVAGILGHDFGNFRVEGEVSNKRVDVDRITLKSAAIPLETPARAAGTYPNPGGATPVLALMTNVLADFGGGPDNPWAVEVGGGVGLGRINTRRWRFNDAQHGFFQNDNKTAFAWQAIAGVRRRVSEHVDLNVRYHYFDIPSIKLLSATNNGLKGGVSSHSILAGATYNF